MAKTFEMKVTRARITTSSFDSADMFEFGDTLVKSIKNRMSRATDRDDKAAPPLTDKYAQWKRKFTPFLTRNLWLFGNLHRAIKVTKVDQNSFTIFFTDPKMAQKMRWNQRRSPMWGVSPSDSQKLTQKVESKRFIKIEREKAFAISS